MSVWRASWCQRAPRLLTPEPCPPRPHPFLSNKNHRSCSATALLVISASQEKSRAAVGDSHCPAQKARPSESWLLKSRHFSQWGKDNFIGRSAGSARATWSTGARPRGGVASQQTRAARKNQPQEVWGLHRRDSLAASLAHPDQSRCQCRPPWQRAARCGRHREINSKSTQNANWRGPSSAQAGVGPGSHKYDGAHPPAAPPHRPRPPRAGPARPPPRAPGRTPRAPSSFTGKFRSPPARPGGYSRYTRARDGPVTRRTPPRGP